jgi:hypothetical protein
MDTTNINALARAAEARANEAIEIALLRRASTSSNATLSTLNCHVDAMPAAAPRVTANLSNVNTISPPNANDDRMTSLVLKKEQLQNVAQPQAREPAAAASARAPPNSSRKLSFVEKLHAVLSNKHFANIITWMPSGKAFCILDKESFTKKVLPTCFREVQFESFSRRIKRWGFRKMYTTGLKQVTYTHDLFQKDRIDLLKTMNGKPGQAATNAAPLNVDDAAKFEAAMTEQAALEKTLVATSATAQKQEMKTVQLPVKKRFVPFHEGTINGTVASTVGTNQGTFRFNGRPVFVGYDQSALYAPAQLQLQQIQMHEMAMMNRRHCQPMTSSTFGGSLLEARLVPYQGAADMNVARQLSSLDDAIAECEEKLAFYRA